MAGNSATIEWKPPDLPQRMNRYPKQMETEAEKASYQSLDEIHKSVPPYAPQLPNQRYVRTERLGQSLGSGFSGGKRGMPNVYQVRRLGAGGIEGRFGSMLPYAPAVVGTGTQRRAFAGRWWEMSVILERARGGIGKAFNEAGKRMVAFLGGGR